MSVTPLDLQTNFSHIGTIGKHVSAENESQVIRQDVISGHILKESQKNAQDVPQVSQNDKDFAKIKDDKRRHQNDAHHNNEDEDNDAEQQHNQSNKRSIHIIENPNEGRHIDIMC